MWKFGSLEAWRLGFSPAPSVAFAPTLYIRQSSIRRDRDSISNTNHTFSCQRSDGGLEVGGLEACSGIHTPTFLCLRTFAKDLFIRPLQKPNNAPLSSAIRHLPDLSLHGGLEAWPLHHPHPSPTKALLHLLYCLLRRGRTYRTNRTYRTAADAACTTLSSVARRSAPESL